MLRNLLVFAPLALLPGCVSRDEQIVAETDAAQRHVGETVAEFIQKTGHTPTEATPLSPSRRMFVFYGSSVTLGTAAYGGVPAMAATHTCRVTAEADRIGSTGTAADFRIVKINQSGPCNGFFT